MWRKATCAASGLLVACAAAYLVPSTGLHAESASFDDRWPSGSKGDRIEGPRANIPGQIHFFELPTMQTTVVVKRTPESASGNADSENADRNAPVARERNGQAEGVAEPRNGSMRQVPVTPARIQPVDPKRKEKLPVGCEPFFSPVTMPNMANVSSRCLS